MNHKIDKETKTLLDRIGARMKELEHPSLNELTPEMSRYYFEEARSFFTPIEVEGIQIENNFVGDREIPVRIYRPEGNETLPIQVFFHGGGWVFGSIDSADSFCKYMANQLECIVVSAGYRLAPEHQYPSAIEDAVEVVRWIAKHAYKFYGDPENIGISGESSGANIAAAASIKLRDMNESILSHQLLITPVTHFAFETSSYNEGYQLNLTKEKMEWFWDHYLQFPEQGKEPLASPLLVTNTSGLPPATIVTVEFDPLRSEGQAYASKLDEDGIEVNSLYFEGLVHSFINMIGEVTIANEAVDQMLAKVKTTIHQKTKDSFTLLN